MDNMMHKCRSYAFEKLIGRGGFGLVWKAKHKRTKATVAIKSLNARDCKQNIMQEMKFLTRIHHANIIRILDVIKSKSEMSLVLEYMDFTLSALINSPVNITCGDIKAYMQMLLKGINYLHSQLILHHDLKPANVLLNTKGILKIADFGLARKQTCYDLRSTKQVKGGTIWYLSPELLLNATQHNGGVDIWAIGCILGELIWRIPMFPGRQHRQLVKIFSILGTPTEHTWPGISKLSKYPNFPKFPQKTFESLFPNIRGDCICLIASLLAMDPTKRCSPSEALRMEYFTNLPTPTSGENLPLPPRLGQDGLSLVPLSKLKIRKRNISPCPETLPLKKRKMNG